MSWQIICSVKVNRFSVLLIQSKEYRDQAPVDQEVGGSSPPSCTKIRKGRFRTAKAASVLPWQSIHDPSFETSDQALNSVVHAKLDDVDSSPTAMFRKVAVALGTPM